MLVYLHFCSVFSAGLLLVAQVQAAEPAPATIPYKVIAEVLANAAVNAQAGVLSFLAPKVRNLVFVYPAGTTNTVTLTRAGKTTALQADKDGRIKVPVPAGAELAGSTLRFSTAPASIEAE